MTGYLATIVGRLGHGAPAVRPRLPARFESPTRALAPPLSDMSADADESPGPHAPDVPTRSSAVPSVDGEPSALGPLREIRRPPSRAVPPRDERVSEPPPLGRPHSREADPVHSAGRLETAPHDQGPALTSTRRDSHETTRATPSARPARPLPPPRPLPSEPSVEPRSIEGLGPPAQARPRTPRVRGQRAAAPSRESEALGEPSTDGATFEPASVPVRRALGVRATTEREPLSRRADHPGPSVSTRRAAEPSSVASAPPPTIEVTIGRIEVRAAPAPARAASTSTPTASVMTLEQYLRSRSDGAGR